MWTRFTYSRPCGWLLAEEFHKNFLLGNIWAKGRSSFLSSFWSISNLPLTRIPTSWVMAIDDRLFWRETSRPAKYHLTSTTVETSPFRTTSEHVWRKRECQLPHFSWGQTGYSLSWYVDIHVEFITVHISTCHRCASMCPSSLVTDLAPRPPMELSWISSYRPTRSLPKTWLFSALPCQFLRLPHRTEELPVSAYGIVVSLLPHHG